MKKSILTTVALTIALVAWMCSGLRASGNDVPDAATGDGPDELMKVEVAQIQPVQTDRTVTLYAQLEPRRRILVRSRVDGTVTRLPVSKGSRVSEGELLVQLAPDGRESTQREAQARLQMAQSQEEAASKLMKQGLQAKLEYERARTELESAYTALAMAQIAIEDTMTKVPFAGVVNSLPLEVGEQVEKGDAIAEIIDDSAFLVSAAASRTIIPRLSIDQTVTLQLFTGEELKGLITFTSAVADKNSGSFRVEVQVDNPDRTLAAGTGATIRVTIETLDAVRLSLSALSIGNEGETGIKTVNASDEVEFHPVDLLRSTSEGSWVTGIPANARIITLGQGFVSVGQRVIPVFMTPPVPTTSGLQS